METNTSIQNKILFAIASVFMLVLLVNIAFIESKQKQMIQTLSMDKAHDLSESYFDGINTFMQSGLAIQSEVLREKARSHDNVLDIRLIRAKTITDIFGPGKPEQAPVDDLDTRALNGEDIDLTTSNENGRMITIVQPILASSNFKGTDCLNCHTVKEGTVLGAIRVSYSLASLDSKINKDLLNTGLISLGLFALGMLLIVTLMRKIVINPLSIMRDTLNTIAQNADLRQRLQVNSNDEIGHVCTSFNSMLSSFSASIKHVSDTSNDLVNVTTQIANAASQTTQAAQHQQIETASIFQAIQELENVVRDVQSGASEASRSSIEANDQAQQSTTSTQNAIQGIYGLVSEIDKAAEVIKRLDEKSKGVSSVLDVIKGLAEQTNLLALNAAIEAARAGEQGRGFAVVADEVRTLATHSHKATEEIEKIIAQLQQEAKDAVTVMNNAKLSAEQRSAQVEHANQGLNAISANVAEISQLNIRMSQSADQQSLLAERVGNSISNINHLSNQTADDAKQTNAFSQELVNLTQGLNRMVNEFKR